MTDTWNKPGAVSVLLTQEGREWGRARQVNGWTEAGGARTRAVVGVCVYVSPVCGFTKRW